jgi:hypothetical protein
LFNKYQEIKDKLSEAECVLDVESVSRQEYEAAQKELESFINPIMQNVVKDGGGEFAQDAQAPSDVPSEPPIE